MGDILSYIDEFGGFTFVEKPFCEVDGLILSHLSYYVYDNVVPTLAKNQPAVAFYEMEQLMDEEHFVSVKWEAEKSRLLFHKAVNARRYRNTKANYYACETNNNESVQFSAVTFLLGSGEAFVSFRGTDDALVGWKEDFYMAYRTPVGAQTRSVEYVNQVAGLLAKKKNLRFFLGGHSKGGNLAVYAAMNCDEGVKRRIAKVYNMDGPGFRPDFLERLDYDGVKDKVLKIVPEESFVGMLMETKNDYTLIQSTAVGMAQHVTLTWRVEGDHFQRSEHSVSQRKELYDRINQWIFAIDKEQVGYFIESLFKLVELTDANTLTDLKTMMPELPKKAHSIGLAYMKMDEETKRIFWEIAGFLIEFAATDQQERLRKWKIADKMKQYLEY